MKKIGGLWHWRIGRIGGSFYISKKKVKRAPSYLPHDFMLAMYATPIGWLLGWAFI